MLQSEILTLDTDSKIDQFEERFEDLQLATLKELEQIHNSVEMIKDRLVVMPSSIMKEHYKYVTSISKRKKPFPNLSAFFQYLNLNCWNFFEYKLLKHVVDRFCSVHLKADMSTYERDMQWFQRQTTVLNFINCMRHRHVLKKRSVPPRFKKLVFEHGIDPDSYTLADLDSFRSDTCLDLKLSECAFQVYLIRRNCIIVEWIFPEEITEELVYYYCGEDGKKLLQGHNVEKALIDGQSLQSVSLTDFSG